MTVPLAIRFALWLGLVCALAVLATLFLFDPARHGFYPQCAFHHLTGLYCPGCGVLRATHELLHGHVSAAFHLNALFVVSLPLLIFYAGAVCFCRLKGDYFPPFLTIASAWTVVVAILSFAVLRNLPLTSLAWLRP